MSTKQEISDAQKCSEMGRPSTLAAHKDKKWVGMPTGFYRGTAHGNFSLSAR